MKRKLSISNVAWQKDEDNSVRALLKHFGFNGVEIAPTKIWAEPNKFSEESASEVKNFWLEEGIEIVALQSLLYGRPDLQIFGAETKREELVEYLTDIFSLGKSLGAKHLVLAAHSNRVVPEEMLPEEALDIALKFFAVVAQRAQDYDVTLLLEPVSESYGCNFITNSKQACLLLEQLSSPNLGLALNSANMFLASEGNSAIKNTAKLLKHFHLSEPNQEAVTTAGKINYSEVFLELEKIDYNNWISIQMLRTNPYGSNLLGISEALKHVSEIFTCRS